MKKHLLSFFSLMLVGCALHAQITALSISVTVTNATSCIPPCNGSATGNVSGGTPPYTYLWNIPLAPQMTQTATGLCPGTYQLGVFDSSTPLPNQGQQLVIVTCNTSTGINNLSEQTDLNIFPNPASAQLFVELFPQYIGNSELIIRNLLGEVVATEAMQLNGYLLKQLNVSSLPAGIYTIEYISEMEAIRSKFIKE